ncbi:hypothetical protein JY651_17570 [Pyxidicoccus parkwayensis]|uniref:Lipoprotein n=1 Tax=Pyxidicoccus parkwayensis TaxID=2813578 RepID=A0ABX7P841_9BACT|nr:hypothetical protein [Pyxidicoccus parkwaysis]QSQ26628.1 hypothetical protein JY651_17570 [Pyxidicoccus parkwaysis]
MSRLRTVLLALAVSSSLFTACKKQEEEKPAVPAEDSAPEGEAAPSEDSAPEPLNAAVVDRFITFEKALNEQAAEPRKALREASGANKAGASMDLARIQDSLREKHQLSDTQISALRLAGSQLLSAQGGGTAAQQAALKQRREQLAALPPDQRAGMEDSIKQMEAQLSGEGAFASLRQEYGDAAADAAKARRDDLLAVTRVRIEQETGKSPAAK